MFHLLPRAGRMLRASATVGAAAVMLCAGPAMADQKPVTAGGISVGQAWTRATPGGAKIGAAYLTIAAAKGTADRLLSASSPAAARVELHTHTMEGDVMKMRRVDDIAVADGKTVLLQPSGLHVMLIDLAAPLKAGDTVKLTLKFEKAGEIAVDAPVEPIGARGPHGLDFQPDLDGKKPQGDAPAHQHHHH